MPNRLHTTVLIAGIVLSLSAASVAWGGVRGSGKFIDEKRTVPAFHAVEVANGIRAELIVGALQPIEVHAEDNIAPLVETEVEGGTLHIRYKRNSSISDDGVTVKITAPQLDGVGASGGSTVEGAVGKCDSLKVEVSGGGEAHLRGLEVKTLDADGSGGATLDLRGTVDSLDLEASGGTRFPLRELAARAVHIDASGGSEGAVRASETVRGDVSGGTDLRVSGGARTKVSTPGGSNVEVD